MSSLIVEVVKIHKIEKHPNADKLCVATLKGWQCIIGLKEFKEDDLVIFIPPDSILPNNLIDEYKLDYLKKGGRLRTIKLRGFISQGLCLPIPKDKNWNEGKSVTEELGIKKYEPPRASYQSRPKETIRSLYFKYSGGKITFRRFIVKAIGLIKNSFKSKKNSNPLFSKYTDIENIKNFNTVFKDGEQVVILEKIHGTNARFSYLKRPTKYFWQRWLLKLLGEYLFIYGSHTVQKTLLSGNGFYGEDVWGIIANRYNLTKIIPKDYIIYGEVYGFKIQELDYGLADIDIVFFDVKYKDKYLSYKEFTAFCLERLLPCVPLLHMGKYSNEELIRCTNGNSILAKRNHKDQIREGCVVKPLIEENNGRIGRKILKSISEQYLVSKNRTEYH